MFFVAGPTMLLNKPFWTKQVSGIAVFDCDYILRGYSIDLFSIIFRLIHWQNGNHMIVSLLGKQARA